MVSMSGCSGFRRRGHSIIKSSHYNENFYSPASFTCSVCANKNGFQRGISAHNR